MSMIRKYHNHKLQTTPWHREEEPLNHHATPGRQIKQSNQLSLPPSVCRTSLSVVELIAMYKAVSSAKSLTLDLTCSGRSFMYARKRIGPRTEPCGTPEETGIFSELIPSVFDYPKSPFSILECLL